MTDITLIDGTIVDNYSKEYMLYCEAKWLTGKDFEFCQEWFVKISAKRLQDIPTIKGYMVLLNAKDAPRLP